MDRPQVSLVIPLYNEADSLPVLAAEIRAALDPLALPYEVLLVDDGSTDPSPRVLARLAGQDRRLRVLRLARNSGQSAALDAGFRHARGEVVVTLDADLQNDPADIPRLLAELEGCDLVSGVRVARQDSWKRRVASRVANRVRRWVTGDTITDVGCSLKACRTRWLRQVPMFTGMHRFLPALVEWQGAVVREVPVHHRPRRFGEAKYAIWNRLWRALADLAAVGWMRRRWIDRRLVEEVAVPEADAPIPATRPEP